MNEAEIRKYAALMKELGLTGIEIDESRGYFRLECEGPKICNSGKRGRTATRCGSCTKGKNLSHSEREIPDGRRVRCSTNRRCRTVLCKWATM